MKNSIFYEALRISIGTAVVMTAYIWLARHVELVAFTELMGRLHELGLQ